MSKKLEEKIKIGTSGWQYDHWKGVFYPKEIKQKEYFHFYIKKFDTVEINNTFYRLPSKKTLKNWHKDVYANFLIAPKASRYITHTKKLKNSQETVSNFLELVSLFKENLGPILFQLPPSFKNNKERLEEFVNVLSQRKKFDFAIEFRNKSWINQETRKLLESNNIAFCIYDMGDFTTPYWTTADFVYLRMHGPKGAYKGKYHGNSLRIWAKRIVKWSRDGKKVYCYFNNDDSGYAPQNAIHLKNLIYKEL